MSTFVPLLCRNTKRALATASYQPIYSNVQYTASKHAILGMMQALGPMCSARGMRCGSVHPWFMGTSPPPLPLPPCSSRYFRPPTDTHITAQKNIATFIAGWPRLPADRVAAAQLCIATDPDPRTSGLPWLMPDAHEVYRLGTTQISEGIYRDLNARAGGVVKMKERAWRMARM